MEIKWSKFALNDLEQIEDYIGKNFSLKEYEKFINLLNHKISIIINRNVKFQKLEKFPNYNKLLLTEQTTLIYRLEEDCLKIFRLYNNYQDDNKKFIIDDLK
ncbi:type II toxin-antitoxin system RelE/ParE family toxin [Cloacibacterium sp.]|uniref:type II toxin-antitoxin system RelE/ParE family toxin n=1 Tax=Cloacibacterium sp. TaxID=1913682 RepID=UPI0035B4385E